MIPAPGLLQPPMRPFMPRRAPGIGQGLSPLLAAFAGHSGPRRVDPGAGGIGEPGDPNAGGPQRAGDFPPQHGPDFTPQPPSIADLLTQLAGIGGLEHLPPGAPQLGRELRQIPGAGLASPLGQRRVPLPGIRPSLASAAGSY